MRNLKADFANDTQRRAGQTGSSPFLRHSGSAL